MVTTQEYIQELKEDQTRAPMIEHNIIDGYKIKILHRGEQLFYFDIKNDKAFICEIQIRNGSIFKDSIKKWDTGERITELEKDTIIQRILHYFTVFQKMEAKLR